MIEEFENLFGEYRQAVIAEKDSKVVYFNSAARELFPKIEENSEITDILPDYIVDFKGKKFTSSMMADKISCAVTVSRGVYKDHNVYTVYPDNCNDGAVYDNLLAGISGELRTSAGVMQLATNLLTPLIESSEDGKMLSYFAMLTRNTYITSKIADNIEFLRSVQRYGVKTNPGVFDIRQCIFDACETVSFYMKEREISVKFKCAAESIMFNGDRRRIEQLLFNLLSNSIKYSPDGSAITVELSGDDKTVFLTVTDSGSGIKSEELSDVFEKYAGTRDVTDVREGCGLGLTIVQHIARMHGGNALLESSDKGTRVSVMLKSGDGFPLNDSVSIFDNPNLSVLTQMSDVLPYSAYYPNLMD